MPELMGASVWRCDAGSGECRADDCADGLLRTEAANRSDGAQKQHSAATDWAPLPEIAGDCIANVHLGGGAHVHVVGKGRKERSTPLTKQAAAVLQAWLKEPARGDSTFAFPNRQGGHMSNDGVQYLLAQHVAAARELCPSLRNKAVSPHMLRHTAAMELLQAGVDTTAIALWLGHESVETTHIYLEADLAMKEKILARTTPHDGHATVYKPDDALLAFLKAL